MTTRSAEAGLRNLYFFRLIFFAGLSFLTANSLFAQSIDQRGARLFKSGPIQITADGLKVWCVNSDNDSVTRIETAIGLAAEFVLPEPSVKDRPHGLSVKEDGSEIWVACHDSDRIYVMNSNGAILAKIDLPWGSGPFSIAISPNQQKALVTLHRGEALAVLDVPNHKLSQILPHLFWAPMGIAWAEGGNAAWVNHIFSPGEHPLQTRVDFSGPEPQVSTAMQLPPADPRQVANLTAPYNVPEGGYLNVRGHPAQIPTVSGRNELWLPTQYHNMNGDLPTPDSIVQSAVRHINLSNRAILISNTDKVVMTAKFVHNTVSSGAYLGPGWNAGVAGPIDIAFSVDGKMAYVLNELSGDLVPLPVSTTNLRPTNSPPLTQIKVGSRPIGVAVSPVTPVAYVYNQFTRDVSVIDLLTQAETKRIAATPVTGEPFAANILLGAKLFHSSDDPRISQSGKMSCASCHLNAEHDGRTWLNQNLPGIHGPRATQTLLGLRLSAGPRDPATGFGQFHRSGDRDEIQDFDFTFQSIQMGGTGFLGTNVFTELGASNAGRSPELDAIADYLLFLDPLQRSPHRTPTNGALSEAAIRGATFFLGTNRVARHGDAGCASCHVPETAFCDFKFHNIGQRHDAAEKELNSRTPAWSVNTPSLVGAWATAPYTGLLTGSESHSAHGSMMALLIDAIGRANTTTNHGKSDGLTTRQLRDLAEFVLSIDGNMTASEVCNARDTQPPRIERAEITSLTRIDVWFSETIKASTATKISNWSLALASGGMVPIIGASFDVQNGDHVILTTQLQPYSSYNLAPAGPILDDADAATGNTSNAIDLNAPENHRALTVTDRLTITLGASGYENVSVAIHDSAMVGPNLSTWNHDTIWMFPVSGGPGFSTAFLRFDWKNAFQNATGVTNSSALLSAGFILTPDIGDSQTFQLRRCLQKWSDPATGGDFNNNPLGAPTWTSSDQGTKAWNLVGAGRLGSNGALTNDYFGTNDLASRVDATVTMKSITEPTEISSPLMADAFRFWFDNPTCDYGYGLRLASGSQETKFSRWEAETHQDGPVLKLTYLLPGVKPKLEFQISGINLHLQWPIEHTGYAVETASSVTGPWIRYSGAVSTNAQVVFVDLSPAPAPVYFRLTKP